MSDAEAQVYALVLGRVVATLRERRGWSQAVLAAQVGLTQSTLSRIERGQVQPDAFTLRGLAAAFGMSAGDLNECIDAAFVQSEQAARRALGERPRELPWWQAAVGVAGLAGLAGLVAFAVAKALDDSKKHGD